VSALSFLHALIARREPSGPVGLVRLAVGLGVVIKLLDVAPKLWRATDPQVLLLPYFEGFGRPTPMAVLALLALGTGAALLFLAGWGGRAPGLVLTAVLGAMLALDQQLYSNHLYLLTLLVALLTLAGAGRAVSLDARHGRGGDTVPGWPVTLLRWQLTLLYLFAALSKLNPAFLSGAVLVEQLPRFAAYPDVLRWASWLGLALEAWLAVGLWWPRTRRRTLVLGVLFHSTVLLFMVPKAELLVFGLVSLGLYRLFFPTVGREPAA
jgi:Vitamin K-dependent gamma-carboxylase